MNEIENVIIIGSGCAGLTAAIYAARANLSPLLIDGSQPGGQLTTTNDVENFPGFPDGINGFQLTDSMRKQASKFGARFADGTVSAVDFSGDVKNVIVGDKTHRAKAVIVATGASPRLLGVRGEREFFGGKGVSVCATCDGAFHRNKDVAVVGGGDAACEEALFLTNFCAKVYLIHRRDALRASKLVAERTLANAKIVPLWNSIVEEITGKDRVLGIKVRSVVNNTMAEVACSGVFIAVGHVPNTQQFAKCLHLDANGYVRRRENSFVETNLDGVFVAGDCADGDYRQAVTAAGTGAMAAIAAERYIHGKIK
ncbi:MAG: thioredoxin-disulfide reductase [Puniceicoccales bacterium]|jgi:thioredoxin reductase (NADPH)|nr:thioredoxin-disulfide reductase [Puniceicoccales bacterium]